MEASEMTRHDTQDPGSDNTGKEKQDKSKKMLELKLRAVGNPDSIFILPYGTEGFKMAHMVRISNKFISLVKRKFGIAMDMSQAKDIFEKFDSLSERLWEFVYEISPNLYNIHARDWRKINDPVELKKNMAHRKASIVIEPRAEEAAKIAMAAKIIQQKRVEVTQILPFQELARFVSRYIGLIEEFDGLLVEVSKQLNEDYRAFSKERDTKKEKK